MLYLAVALLGVAAWRNIPIELLPETQLPRLTISAQLRGASPEITEALLTSPLEEAVQQVRGVEKITSTSSEQFGAGRAQLDVEFGRNVDMEFARLELSERLAALEDELPAGTFGPQVQPYVPDEFRQQDQPFLTYTVTGPYTLETLRQWVEDVVEPDLLQVDGVATMRLSGGRQRLIEIELSEPKIQALGLNLSTVRRRIRELEQVREAGTVEEGGTLRTLAIRETAKTPADIRQLILYSDRDRLVRLSDVASVHDTYEDARQYYRIDGQPAVAFEVVRGNRTNAVAVADRVKERVAAIEPSVPAGVRMLLDNDESKDIRQQLTDLRTRAMIAAAVIFAVLLLFMGSFRSAGIVFATIAFSILIALNLMYFGGYTLNVLTLMGLAMGFGLIVDNAIVVLENIWRKRQRGDADPIHAAESGAREVILPILAATATTVIVFIPFIYLQGELRAYYMPFALVVGMSLAASLFVAFTFIPSLAVRLLGARDMTGAVGDGAREPWYQRLYGGMVGLTLRWPWITMVVALGILGGSWRLFDKHVTRGVLWGGSWGQQSYIQIIIRLPRGEELDQTDQLTRFFEDRLRTMPEVEKFSTWVQPQYAYIRVEFPDALENSPIPPAIKEQLVAYSYQFGGAEVRVYGYGPSFYGGGVSPPNYNIKVLGYNYEEVRRIAEDIGDRLRRFSRIRDVDVNSASGFFQRDKASEFVLNLNRRALGLHGLTAADVVGFVAAAVGGRSREEVMRVGGEEVQYAVTLAGNRDVDLLELENLLIPAPDGTGVRLADVATLREREVLARIVRENQQYQRVVSYEFRGPTRLGDRVRDAVVQNTVLPDGYTIEKDDTWRWDASEQKAIWQVLAVSLVLIYMVTAALFESLRQPIVVLLTVPMALVGVFLTFFYSGATFTREAYIGVIMMGGIVVNNAILLVDHINHLRRVDGVPFFEAVRRGTIERVRPILMTSATTIFGLLPLVLFSKTVDTNIWNALGLALIGGLLSSTVFVLTVTPAVYLVFERRKERKRVTALTAAEAG